MSISVESSRGSTEVDYGNKIDQKPKQYNLHHIGDIEKGICWHEWEKKYWNLEIKTEKLIVLIKKELPTILKSGKRILKLVFFNQHGNKSSMSETVK